jgi:hypothetical protein
MGQVVHVDSGQHIQELLALGQAAYCQEARGEQNPRLLCRAGRDEREGRRRGGKALLPGVWAAQG